MHGISFDVDGQWFDIRGNAAAYVWRYTRANPRTSHRMLIILLFLAGYTFHHPIAPSKVIAIG